ncbi:GreA/GreB family elongation factor, partial [Tabrizicola sp.]|uniref:GreA/GreB family elongation factor n=1 Tax=Tabrizicola sp. TaxID=2005166 RepID=UPI003F339617
SHDLTAVAFGLAVTVADETGLQTTYEIVGEDEADATRHRIAPNSPLARALLGAVVGDSVTWKRPSGAIDLEVMEIAHADP